MTTVCTTVAGPREWLSVHVSFEGSIYGASADRVILKLLGPLVRELLEQGWMHRYFFVRYGAGGAHVRFRVLGWRSVLHDRVLPLILERAGACRASDRQDTGESAGPVRVEPVVYEPEWDRYGGPSGIALAEWHFHASSEAAIRLLRGVPPGDAAARLAKALLAMVVLAHAFSDDRAGAVRFLRLYRTRYLQGMVQAEERRESYRRAFENGYTRQADGLAPYVEETWSRLELGEALSVALDDFVLHVRELRRRFDRLAASGGLAHGAAVLYARVPAMHRIVPSYVHMMSNRLGVPIIHEAYLANLIARALGTPAARAS
ncbi:MAG TPA: thiopeptide-type bacteriocin biosynthesis protein [Gemmatimonadales bacterium]